MHARWSASLVFVCAVAVGPSPSAAKLTCIDGSACERPDVVAAVRDAIEAACPCDAQPGKRAYRRCAKQELRRQRQTLGATGLPKPCRKEITRAYKNAVCGRPGTVPCNRTNRKGRTRCVVTTESRCPAEAGRSSPCGAFTSCVDACVPTGGCPDVPSTTLPPSTTTTSTTATTSSSVAASTSTLVTTSSTVTTSTSTLVTTSSTVATSTSTLLTTSTTATSTTTTTFLPTTLPCADVNLGQASPLTVVGTTADVANDVEPPEACLSIPLSGGPDVLYEWTAPASGVFVFDTRATPFDSVVLVLGECGGTVLACNDDADGFGVLGSRTQATLSAGQTVLVVVDSAGEPGPYTLEITGPFAADDCCVAHDAPGCNDAVTEACVCGADALCCSEPWDPFYCVWRAIARCEATCG